MGRIETPLTFNLVSKIATQQDWKNNLFLSLKKELLILIYRGILLFSKSHFIVEKSHPSLWLAEFLLKRLRNVYFIAVWRDVEPTVSSTP